jgi:hypothetical protein
MLGLLAPGVGMGASEEAVLVDTRIYDAINRRRTSLAPEILRDLVPIALILFARFWVG